MHIRLQIDRALSGGKGKAVIFASSVVLVLFSIILGLNIFFDLGFEPKRVIQLLLSAGSIRPAEPHFGIQVLIALSGTMLVTGMLISMLTNTWRERSDRYRRGLNDYPFSHHLLFIGDSPMLADTLVGAATGNSDMIVVITRNDAQKVYERLLAQISESQIERRIVVLYGDYERREQLERAYAHTARAIYILGETIEGQDTVNLSCLEHIRSLHKPESEVQDVFLLLTRPHLLRGAQLSNEQPTHEGIRLLVIHRHETWAQRVLVSNGAVGATHYPTLDRGHLESDSDRQVHLIISGSQRMALAMATTAAHIAHYPNFLSRGIRTRITLIDPDMDNFVQMMRGQYSALMRLSHWTLLRATDRAIEVRNTHVPDAENDFLDIEWEFISARLNMQPVRDYIEHAALSDTEILTIALTDSSSDTNIADAISLPRIVQDRQIPVLVYQPYSKSMTDWMQQASCFRHLYPFGMSGDCYDPLLRQRLSWARASNDVYNAYLCSIGQESNTTDWDDLRMVDQFSNLYHANYDYAVLRRISDSSLYGRLEHCRWNMEKLLMGFEALDSSEARRRADRVLSEKRELKSRFIHPNIAPFEDLTRETQEIDSLLVTHLLEKMATK